MGRTVAEATRLGTSFLDIHLSGGEAMVRQAVQERNAVCRSRGLPPPALLGVTVLTSLNSGDLASLGITRSAEAQVLSLAEMGKGAGLEGFVASPREIAPLRRRFGPSCLIVTPGIRPEGWPPDDQVRTLTPREAAEAGADFLVVGRPITAASKPLEAARSLTRELRP